MIGKSEEATVTVCGETCKLTVHHSMKTVWIVYGTFQERGIEAKGRTKTQAISNWKSKVEGQEFN